MEQKLIAEPNLVSPMPAVHSSIRGRRSGPPEVEKRSRKYLSLGLTQNAPVLDVPFTRGSYHHHGIGRLEAGETARASLVPGCFHWYSYEMARAGSKGHHG